MRARSFTRSATRQEKGGGGTCPLCPMLDPPLAGWGMSVGTPGVAAAVATCIYERLIKDRVGYCIQLMKHKYPKSGSKQL